MRALGAFHAQLYVDTANPEQNHAFHVEYMYIVNLRERRTKKQLI